MVALVSLAPLAGRAALALAGGEIVKQATRSILTGAGFQSGAELVYQIAEWARSIDADWDSQGMEPTPAGDLCWEVDGAANCVIDLENPPINTIPGWNAPVKRIISVVPAEVSPGAGLGTTSEATLELPDGQIVTATSGSWPYNKAFWYLDPLPGSTCTGNNPDAIADPLALPPIQQGDCTINVTLEGFLANPNGTGGVEPVWLMEPAQELRASGGVIVGGCNFQPTVVVGGGGDGKEPPISIPAPNWPTASDPWWEYIAEGITGAVVEDIYSSIKEALFGQLDPASFTLVAPCNETEDGQPETFTVEFPKQDYQSRMEAWQIASAQLLQQHLDWKTPICRDRPKLEGNWRTISFRSTQSSPYGKSCIRKRFRYRSLSGIGLGELVDYWKDFTWTTGPVCVTHKGHSWGTPQVWASTADEGKRVIQHAAGEAGFDANQVGQWGISNSSSSRYGVSLPVKVDTTGGYYWITDRDGSDGRPIVAI